MNDFQEQAKNWLRNVVKQNPDKIKAGVEKAGDLIDKQTGGKYAEKVDTVQQKVGTFVDKQTSEEAPGQAPAGTTSESTTAGTAESPQPNGTVGTADGTAGTAESAQAGSGEAPGQTPDPAVQPDNLGGSSADTTGTGSTATGQQS
jgi:hypothetical protein